ncbi:MAG: hypothetical protein KDK91_03335 [Gammaproteobacteria bacterium]|nr:hypothetical protein [Gammaproteobacteria bacterium]
MSTVPMHATTRVRDSATRAAGGPDRQEDALERSPTEADALALVETAPTPPLGEEHLLSRASLGSTKRYRIDFRALRDVVPPEGTSPTPFPTPGELGLDVRSYRLVVEYLHLDPRTSLVDLTQSDLQAAARHFRATHPDDYEQRIQPILDTFAQWVVLKTDVLRYFAYVHEMLQDTHSINADTVTIVGDMLRVPTMPAESASFDVAEFMLITAGAAVGTIGAFSLPLAIAGELALFALSATVAVASAHQPDNWTPTDPEADRVQGLIKIRERLTEVYTASLRQLDEVSEAVLADWKRLNTVSRLILPRSDERASALTAMTKAFERNVWRQLLPGQVQLRYSKVTPEVVTRLHSADQDIEPMRSVALSAFAERATTLIARRIAEEPDDPFTVVIARTGRAELVDTHLQRHWNFVLGRFTYSLHRLAAPGEPLETQVMHRLLSSGVTRRELYENFGLSSNGLPPTKPALNVKPMTSVRYNVYSESASYATVRVDGAPYILSLNRTTGDLFINQWMPDETATREAGALTGFGPILRVLRARDADHQPVDLFLGAQPTNGRVGIYRLEAAARPDAAPAVTTRLTWSTSGWTGSTVYTPIEIGGDCHLLVATPSTGQVWIKRVGLRGNNVTVSDAWSTNGWVDSTEYVPLQLGAETYLLIGTPATGLAWLKRVVRSSSGVEVQAVWSTSGWSGSTVYRRVDMPGRALFLVATPSEGRVWLKEVLVRQGRVEVVDRWSTNQWLGATTFQSFSLGNQTWLAVAAPTTGQVWIRSLLSVGEGIQVKPAWSATWPAGRREFLPLSSASSTQDSSAAAFGQLIAAAVDAGVAKALMLDTHSSSTDLVVSCDDLFELFPNPDSLATSVLA